MCTQAGHSLRLGGEKNLIYICCSSVIQEESLQMHNNLHLSQWFHRRGLIRSSPGPSGQGAVSIFQMGKLRHRDTERVNEQVTLPSSGQVRMTVTEANAMGPGR